MRRGYSPAATAAFVTTLLVLGLVGWSIGWLAAGNETPMGSGTPTPTATQTTKSPTPSPTRSPSPSPTSSQRTDSFEMPDLVGKKFRDARQDAFKLKLGVTVRFDEPSDKPAGTVVKTNPVEKTLVYPGLTIIIHVAGPAVPVIVPALAGKTCREGKDELVAAGLRIKDYPTGENGTVTKTDPPALTELKWNDEVRVYCAAS